MLMLMLELMLNLQGRSMLSRLIFQLRIEGQCMGRVEGGTLGCGNSSHMQHVP